MDPRLQITDRTLCSNQKLGVPILILGVPIPIYDCSAVSGARCPVCAVLVCGTEGHVLYDDASEEAQMEFWSGVMVSDQNCTRLCLQICGRGWFWEARKICCRSCHHTDNTGRGG